MNFLTLFIALLIATAAAVFSIMGLQAIFIGAIIPVTIMGIVLELGKFQTAVWLHKNWTETTAKLKYTLVMMTVVLMFITSMGIFGLLSKSFLAHTQSAGNQSDKVVLLEQQIERLVTEKSQLNKQLENLDRYESSYLNSADEKTIAKGVRLANRQKAQKKEIFNRLATIAEEQTSLETALLPLKSQSRALEQEVGPVLYIAEAIYGERSDEAISSAVRWVIFLIIFAFDPLAVLLLIAAQQSFLANRPKVEPSSNLYNELIDATPAVAKEPDWMVPEMDPRLKDLLEKQETKPFTKVQEPVIIEPSPVEQIEESIKPAVDRNSQKWESLLKRVEKKAERLKTKFEK